LRSSSREHEGYHPDVSGRRPLLMRDQLQAGFLTCALPQGSFPSSTISNGQWIGASEHSLSCLAAHKMPLGFPIRLSEQALTAARPSRILTAFPFDYPKLHVRVPAKRGPKCGAKYLAATQTADLARGLTTGSSGPAVGLSPFQRAKATIIKLSSSLQAKNKKLLLS